MHGSLRFLAIPLTLLAFAGCADGAADHARPGSAPLIGSGDGTDGSDRGCNVILRELARVPAAGGFATECVDGYCWFVWGGSVDVSDAAIAEGAYPEVTYQSGSDQTWWVVGADPIDGAPAGYQRFGFRFYEHTVSPGMSMTALMRTRIQMVPYLITASGGRLFDHNRNPGDFDNYLLIADNEWSIGDDLAVCYPVSNPVALQSAQVATRISYPAIMRTSLKGVVRAGADNGDDRVIIHYQVRSQYTVTHDWTTVEATSIRPGLWEFETPIYDEACPHYCPRQVYQFAIEHKSGGESFWDNNGGPGIDYVLANDIGGSVPVYFGDPAILDTPIQLSYADWDGDYGWLEGELLLQNLAYEKDVAVVYTTDDWATVREAPANFSRITYGNLEYFRFRFQVTDAGDEIKLALRYRVAGAEHWDNNFDRDYTITR